MANIKELRQELGQVMDNIVTLRAENKVTEVRAELEIARTLKKEIEVLEVLGEC